MDREQSKKIVEALLFVSDKPVSIDTIMDVIEDLEATEVKSIIEELNSEYLASGRSFSVKEIALGFQMLTDPVYSKWISALFKKGPDRLTGPGLETLAIIAYKQPLTRSDIEAIRGVNVDGVLRTLEERQLIRTRGRLDAPGRPILYGTSTEFLQHFGLKSLDDLPKLREFKESDLDFVREQEKAQIVNMDAGKIEPPAQPAPTNDTTEPVQHSQQEAHNAETVGMQAAVETPREGNADGTEKIT